MHYAVKAGLKDNVTILLRAGADPDVVDRTGNSLSLPFLNFENTTNKFPKSGLSPKVYAQRGANEEMAALFLEREFLVQEFQSLLTGVDALVVCRPVHVIRCLRKFSAVTEIEVSVERNEVFFFSFLFFFFLPLTHIS